MKHRLTADTLHAAPEPSIATTIAHVPIEPHVALDVAMADARQAADDPTVLFFLPWSEYVARPDAMDRYRLIAEAMSARVVALGNLGMGPRSEHIPRAIRRDIERGDLGSHTQLHIEALQRLSIPLAHVSLMGYSLGTAMASRFARELSGYGQVDALTFGEPVGITRQHTIPLMGKFVHEVALWARNRDATRAIHPDWMPAPSVHGESVRHFLTNANDYLPYARGLATAPIPRDLAMAYGDSLAADVPIRIANGGASVISTTAENERFVASLVCMGFTHVTHDTYDGESHDIIDIPRKIIPFLTAS